MGLPQGMSEGCEIEPFFQLGVGSEELGVGRVESEERNGITLHFSLFFRFL